MKALAVAIATVAVLAGCGGGGGGGGSPQPAGSTKVTMTDFKFDPSTLNATHGKAVFFLVNSGAVSHDMIIQDSAGNRVAGSELVSAGDSFVFTVDNIAAGTYTFICDQDGHKALGMLGTLTVT
jgi:plastocyanin